MLFSIAVVACGGGGGGSTGGGGGVPPPVVSTLSFPLLSGVQTIFANGFSKSFTISGSCSGTGNTTKAPANTATTFEGQSALSGTQSYTLSFTNCAPATQTHTATRYFNSSNYYPLGSNMIGVRYGVFLTPPSLPASVIVGDTGVFGSETLWTDSTKATGNGRVDLIYVIEPDTSSTAIFNVISRTYNVSSILTVTQQERYRMNSTGALTPISLDLQYANGSTTHLVWTYD
jgi:hypothetical protein